MDLKNFRPGLLPLEISPRLAFEAALVVALSLSLIYSGLLKQRLAAERAQHGEYIAQVTAAAVSQSALASQKEAEARELSAQIEQKGRAHEEAIRAAFADARRRVRDAARPGGASPVPAVAGGAPDPEGSAADAGVPARLGEGGADEACAVLTERYLLWQDFYESLRAQEAGRE